MCQKFHKIFLDRIFTHARPRSIREAIDDVTENFPLLFFGFFPPAFLMMKILRRGIRKAGRQEGRKRTWMLRLK